MNILGIETSCDETAAAIVTDGRTVHANIISSQIAAHAHYGGVVPELAAREHMKAIDTVVQTALAAAKFTMADIDAVAVTHAPGLVPALLVGVAYAKGLAFSAKLPFIGINHFIAHIYGTFLENPDRLQEAATYPILALVVSGGHTALVLIRADGRAEVIGSTIDDAAGEAFDKAAKILNLGYPGGPVIDKLAKQGNPTAVHFPRGLLPRHGHPVAPENRFNFSFSGVKTALLYHVQKRELTDAELVDVVASYQDAIVDTLVTKTLDAAEFHRAPVIVLSGGVACNSSLRRVLTDRAVPQGRQVLIAPPKYCTDNAAMVAGLAWHYLRRGQQHGFDLSISARLPAELGHIPFTGS